MNTVYIIGKELRQTAPITVAFLLVYAAMAIFGSAAPERLFALFAVMASGAYVISAILIAERYEERNNGYGYLLRMPVLPGELAAGKLIQMLLVDVLSCALMVSAVRLYGAGPEFQNTAQSIVLLAGTAWLFLILVMYVGICTLGYTRFVHVFRISIMALLVLVQVLLMLLLKSGAGGGSGLARLANGISGAPWGPICILASILYLGSAPWVGAVMRRRAGA